MTGALRLVAWVVVFGAGFILGAVYAKREAAREWSRVERALRKQFGGMAATVSELPRPGAVRIAPGLWLHRRRPR